MHHQIEHIHAIHADHLRVAERHRVARDVPAGPSVWARLVGHLSPRRDRGVVVRRPEGEHGAAGLTATSTQAL